MSFFTKTEERTKAGRYGQPEEKYNVTVIRKDRVIMCAAAALIAIILILNCFTVIPSGYTGVKTTYGQVSQDVIQSGISFKIPFVQKISKVNNKQQEITFKDAVWGETSERTVVYMKNITVTYRINAEFSAWLYTNVSSYKQNALPETLVASALKAAMVELDSSEVTNRGLIEPLCVEKLQEATDAKYGGQNVIYIVAVNVNDMDFEDSYNEAIAAKQVAQMQYETQKIQNQTSIEAANAEAEKQRISAQAAADAQIIAAQAEADSIMAVADAKTESNNKIAESLTALLIEYEKISKWNGQLPTVSGADGTLINID